MAWRWTIALASAAGAAAALLLWLGGERTFVTDPVATAALAAAAIVVARLRHSAAGARPAVLGLAVALVGYLLAGVWVSAWPHPVSAGLWSVGWLPINALLAAVGLLVGGMRRSAVALLTYTGAVALVGAFLVRPVTPFTGVATVSPESWVSTASGVVDVLVVAMNLALAAPTIALAVRARRASVVDRRGLARAAAVASSAPCLVLVCYALAVLRDPGEVDPTTGSVAYTVAIAGLAVVAGWGVVTNDRLALRVLSGIWATAVAVLLGVIVGGLLGNATLAVVAVVALTCAVAAVTFVGVRRFESWSRVPAPRVIGHTVPGLTPRENDVLAAVAGGATNAGVASDLFLSERTVEQHLRSIFDKLDLGDRTGSNRRVRAASVWWARQQSAQESDTAQSA